MSSFSLFDAVNYSNGLDSSCRKAKKDIFKLYQAKALFHGSVYGIFFFELLYAIASSYNDFVSVQTGISISLIIFSLFAYLIAHYYMQSTYHEQKQRILSQFAAEAAEHVQLDQLPIAYFRLFEHMSYTTPSSEIQSQSLFYQIMQTFWNYLNWKEVLLIKENLLILAIKGLIQDLKDSPEDPDIHKSVLHIYLELKNLYAYPQKPNLSLSQRLFASAYENYDFKERHANATTLAIEELLIIDELQPNRTWVHKQLGKCYLELENKPAALKHYEIASQLSPDDHELLHTLGSLYFSQRQIRLGLKVHKQLKPINATLARSLINDYDSASQELFYRNF